jgi:hypothetical protein
MRTYLIIGGLVAAGFDKSGDYLLTVTHSGRGVFSTRTWERVTRDYTSSYPENGAISGIGPISDQTIRRSERDHEKGAMRLTSPDGKITLDCESSGIAVEVSDA